MIEIMISYIKIIFLWLGAIGIFLSFACNIFFAGIIWSNTQQTIEYQSYIRYKDSVELVIRDKYSDELRIR